MAENIQTKDKPDPKRIGRVFVATMLLLGAYSTGIIIGHTLKNFSFSFKCSYNKEYEEEEHEENSPSPAYELNYK